MKHLVLGSVAPVSQLLEERLYYYCLGASIELLDQFASVDDSRLPF